MIIPTTQEMYNRYMSSSGQAQQDYGDIMGRYKNYLDDPKSQLAADKVKADTVNYKRSKELGAALSGYGEFAKTGGFSPTAIRDLRARGVSPIRSAYGNTVRELDRSRALGGAGGSANYIAARSRAQRELPQQLSDAMQNVNAGLSQMVQQGRLAGLGGLSSTAQADIGFGQKAALANQDARLRAAMSNQSANLQAGYLNQGNRLGALSGMSSLYSATPGQASMFGNQLLNSTGNWLNAQQLQQQLGQWKTGGQFTHSQQPTGFQAFLGNMGKIGDIGADIASIPWKKGG
jgi:hypothetical protein